MATNKTQATPEPVAAGVAAHLAAIADPARRQDCLALVQLMQAATGEPPVMWGTAIVGFGRYHYRYDSGREGDACLTGFASRKADISVYLTASFDGQEALLARLGKHKMAKACLSIKRLADVDLAVLAQLVRGSVAAMKQRHG